MSATTHEPQFSAALAAQDRAHVIHPHRPRDLADQVIMERGEGCRVWDLDDNEYLDANAGLAFSNIGHGRTEIVEAVASQMAQLEYFPSFWEFGNRRSVELATRLVELAPAGLDRVFFTTGGSEGIEVAVRIARYYNP